MTNFHELFLIGFSKWAKNHKNSTKKLFHIISKNMSKIDQKKLKLFLHEKIWWQKFSKNKNGALKKATVFKYNIWRRKLNYLLKVKTTD